MMPNETLMTEVTNSILQARLPQPIVRVSMNHNIARGIKKQIMKELGIQTELIKRGGFYFLFRNFNDRH